MTLLIAPLIVFISVILYGFIHSLLASLPVKALVHRWIGKVADRVYRLVYNLFAVISFLPILGLVAILPDHTLYSIPFPYSLVTVTFQVLASILLLIGLLQTSPLNFIGLRQLFDNPDEREPELVISGLYRWVRHPLYTAGLLFIWFTPLMSVNVLALNIGLTLYIIVGAIFEERKLVEEFGKAYLDYQSRTPMLIPVKISFKV